MRILNTICYTLLLALGAASHLQAQPRITYPNGGETFYPRQDITIRWEGADSGEVVGLQYSSDGGDSWTTIKGATSGLQHPWRLPQTPSDRYLVKLTSTTGGQRIFTGYNNPVYGIGHSSDGRLLVAHSAAAKGITVKDRNSGETLWTVADGEWAQPSPTHGTVITITGKTGILRDINTGAAIDTLSEAAGKMNNARFSPDGLLLVSVGTKGEVEVWDGLNGAHLRTLGKHTGSGVSIRFSRTGERVVTYGQRDITIKVWNPKTGALVQGIKVHGNEVLGVAISPDGTKAAALSDLDGQVHVYDVESGQNLFSASGRRRIMFSPDGSQLLAGVGFGGVYVYDVASGKFLYETVGSNDELYDALYSPDGERFAILGTGGSITLWNARTGALQKVLEGHKGFVQGGEFSRDGRTLVTGGDDQTVRIWSPDEFQHLADVSDATFTIWPTTLMLSEINMGRVAHGLRRDSTVAAVLRNSDSKPLRVENLTITGPDAASFALLPDASAMEIPPSSTADIRLRFTPARAGLHQATLEMDADGQHLGIGLKGEGRMVALLPQIEEIDFGQLPMHQQRDSLVSVVFRNTTDSTISVDSVRCGSFFFPLLGNTNQLTVEAGGTLGVHLRFAPTSADKDRTWLRVFYEGKDVAQVWVTGEGVLPASVAGESGAGGMLNVYPNPSGDRMTAEFVLPKAGQVRLLVQDLFGRVVRFNDLGTLASGPHGAEVDMSALASGSYLLVLDAAGGRRSSRITVVR